MKFLNLLLINILTLTLTKSASACATCYGDPNSAMVKSINWGILTLGLVVLAVLAILAYFFIQVARREKLLQN